MSPSLTANIFQKRFPHAGLIFFFLLNVPVNNFPVILGRSHRFLGIYQYFGNKKSLAQGHYTAVVGFKPWTPRSGV